MRVYTYDDNGSFGIQGAQSGGNSYSVVRFSVAFDKANGALGGVYEPADDLESVSAGTWTLLGTCILVEIWLLNLSMQNSDSFLNCSIPWLRFSEH